MRRRKKAYWKSVRRHVSHSKGRFLSIFLIVFLGAGVFSGLRNTPASMAASANDYIRRYHYADLTYIATLGFSEEDVMTIEGIEGVDTISPGYQTDAQFLTNDTYYNVTMLSQGSYEKGMLNEPELIKGRLIEAEGECLIDDLLVQYGYDIDSEITLKNDNDEKTFKVVGIVYDVRYISRLDRGTNSLGDGTNSGFVQVLNSDLESMAIHKDLKDLRDEGLLYTSILVKGEGTDTMNVFDDEYNDYIEVINTRIKSEMSEKISNLYDDLVEDAKKELEDAEKKYDKSLDDYNDSLDEFNAKIDDAKLKLIEAELEVLDKEKKYYTNKSKMVDGNDKYAKSLKQVNKAIESLRKSMNALITAQATQDMDAQQSSAADINKQLVVIEKYIEAAGDLLKNNDTLDRAKVQLDEAKLTIEKSKLDLEKQEIEGKQKFAKAETKLEEAKTKIEDANEAVNDIPKGILYSLSAQENEGIAIFDANRDAIASIGDVFPLIFFLVSALVSLTTMTRMVEEQRGYCGTLRAIGYSKGDLIGQYMLYAFMATALGCAAGIAAGDQIFPRVIYYLYQYMMFIMSGETIIVHRQSVMVAAVIISVIVTMAATLSACLSELTAMPSVLMRPRAPKMGQRILLERVGLIWNRLNFNQKVTMRNIFRYKKRFLMSVIGIAGCTGLIIVGFGIKDSVSHIVELQYKHIYTYDATVKLNEEYNNADAVILEDDFKNMNEVTNATSIQNNAIELLNNSEDLHGSLYVYRNADAITNFISFNDYKTKESFNLTDDGVVLTQKAAELLKVKEGESFDILLDETNYNVKVSHICENYYLHIIYMSKTYYEDLTGLRYQGNNIYLNLKNHKKSTKAVVGDHIKANQLGSISYMDNVGGEFSTRIQSLNIIIAILIGCAAALCFIVLYNLTNINIGERQGEIATIKVLGFRKREYHDYIFRENVVLSLIGSLLGMPFGIIMHRFIIKAVELDSTLFLRTLAIRFYVYGFVLTIGFTYIINFLMHHILDRVNMVESLKTIE